MKIVLAILPLAAMVACGTAPKDDYEQRAAEARAQREAQVEKAISKAPDWMTKLPVSTSAVYANGTATSSDMSMADYKAKLFAYGKICMAAGGQVNQQSKIFMQDGVDSSTEISELAIKSMCPNVDITGVELKDIKRTSEGGRFRTYALVALPTGDANQLQKRKDNIKAQERAERRSSEAFREIDQNSQKFSDTAPVKTTPSVKLYPDPTAQ